MIRSFIAQAVLLVGVIILFAFPFAAKAQTQIRCEPVLALTERFKNFEHALDYRYLQKGDKDFIFLVMVDYSSAVYVLIGGGHMACQAGYASAAQTQEIFPEYKDKGT